MSVGRVLIEKNVAVPMRYGVLTYGDLYRPAEGPAVPALVEPLPVRQGTVVGATAIAAPVKAPPPITEGLDSNARASRTMPVATARPFRGELQWPSTSPAPAPGSASRFELYESSGGTEGTTLRETGMPVLIVTNTGKRTGAIRKTPLMRVQDGDNYVLVASKGGAPQHPVWVYNLRADPAVEIRDMTKVQPMRVREVEEGTERSRLWALAVEAYSPYEGVSRPDRAQDSCLPR